MKRIPRISKTERLAQFASNREEPENSNERPDGMLAVCMSAIRDWESPEYLIEAEYFPPQDIDDSSDPTESDQFKNELEFVKTELNGLGWTIKEIIWPGNEGEQDSVTIVIE